ncbi:MAG: Sir2 family NAD-dependent protein deacetylase [Theionarchaea archaeon]|nr:Sir2 family NAD-dependent protein deacetylase [Theionarchaea archaeon]
MDTQEVKEVAEFMRAQEVAALTGAGISVPSGIPDFRSKNGLWTKYDPHVYGSYQRFIQDPSYFWEMHLDVMSLIRKGQPNPAHKALANLEENGLLKGVITQNIDGLHQRAGSHTVYELHGSNETCSCIICGKECATDVIADHLFSFRKDELIRLMRKGREIPTCECGGYIKPDVILFGELMPLEPLQAAQILAASCDVLLVVGSSLQATPAASLPIVTKENQGTVIILNRESGVMDWMADYVLLEYAEEVLPLLAHYLLEQ